MSGFSAIWLAQRETADARARSRELVGTLPRKFSEIVDLGAGTGANFRWLAPQLDSGQHWTLIDNDSKLLVAARKATRVWAKSSGCRASGRGNKLSITDSGFDCTIKTQQLDLSKNLSELELPANSLVTASALFDLVSKAWLEKLVTRLAASGASVLWTLSYDGRVMIDPALDDDNTIIALLNRHQLTDKGFGPALGPDAWLVAQSLLEHAGFNVRVVDSSWNCGSKDKDLLKTLIEGWTEAAMAVSPADKAVIEKWSEHRLKKAAAGKLQVSVGHRDLAAQPGAASAQPR